MALTLRRLKSGAPDFDQRLASLLNRTGEMDGEVDSTVRAIIQRVRVNGDAALLSLTHELDGLEIDEASALE
ncbi:MAG: histidinol dehydrogenase, partial [Gammaproteobacteria bacterium]